MERGDFTSVAQDYAATRPGYPAALADRLVARLGLQPGDPVAELGAGTGLFTRVLAGRGLDVVALEPNAAMRAEVPPLEGVRVRAGSFAEPGLATSSMCWIVAAQSFQFADAERDLPRLIEALRPGAALSIIGNLRDPEHPAVRLLTGLSARHVPRFSPSAHLRDPRALLLRSGLVDPVLDEEHHAVPMTRERFVAMVSTFNLLAAAAGEEAMGALLADLEAGLAASGWHRWDMPLRARAVTAWRPT